ncbi:MAG: hypothetical protein LDL16_03275 [Thiobacillus sp.]|nr:hypothetical protein [Thiobacillus sp.]
MLPAGLAVARTLDPVQGLHVRRQGDMPEARETAKTVVKALQTQCDSPMMKQACLTTLSDPAATPKAKSGCKQMMSGFKLSGNLNSVGEFDVDEYYVPALGRSARIVRTGSVRQTGVCTAVVEQQEKFEIVLHRATGFTRYERRTDKLGQPFWMQFEHKFAPDLADMLKTAVDATQLNGKVTVSASLGNKTLVVGRPCEIRRINAGAVEFTSCIHATGLKFPSHVTFESELLAGGKTSRFEKLVSYAHDVALSRDLFFPRLGEKVMTQQDARSDPNNPMKRWCAAEKARTGVDPCEAGDE